MRLEVSGKQCLVPDDKLSSKVWSCDPVELFAFMLSNVASDPMWQVLTQVSKESLHMVNHAKATLGLPLYLRSVGSKRVHGLPVLFGFVKLKCFQDAGGKVCGKHNHSCIRRVLDTSQTTLTYYSTPAMFCQLRQSANLSCTNRERCSDLSGALGRAHELSH
jgi:hypothetical protein